ncbi:MAG TPA: metalloregulator ArsR/SmtB family transcription factor [Candidatus Acidoferrales bacterium]|nr:metalloregulator ArsR/SmtB family transcription factor [Candidatus Acidoferrales bacterium]
MERAASLERFSRFADMFSAIGAEPRLRILRLLLAAHPQGLIVSEIQEELGIPSSTLSHHLEKLKHEELVTVRRERQFLWHAANTEALKELMGFLYEECCTRSRAISPEELARTVK